MGLAAPGFRGNWHGDVQIGDKGPKASRPYEREPWNHAVSLRLDGDDPRLVTDLDIPGPVMTPDGAHLVAGSRRSVGRPLSSIRYLIRC